MSYVAITFILLLSVSPVFLSCTKAEISNSSSASPGAVIPNVPFVKQKYRFCGPAALTSVLRYYGRDTDQDEIAERVYTPELKGSLISDMKHYAKENGFVAVTKNGDLETLTTLIDENKPIILLVDKGKLGISIQHYYVVYGYNPENNLFIIHDGKRNGNEISYRKLDKEWEKMNRLMLVINYED